MKTSFIAKLATLNVLTLLACAGAAHAATTYICTQEGYSSNTLALSIDGKIAKLDYTLLIEGKTFHASESGEAYDPANTVFSLDGSNAYSCGNGASLTFDGKQAVVSVNGNYGCGSETTRYACSQR